MTTASVKVSSVPLRKKYSSRSNSTFVKKPYPVPLTKLSLNSSQNSRLPQPWGCQPNGPASFLPRVPRGLPVSVLSILDQRGSSMPWKVLCLGHSWDGGRETLSLRPSILGPGGSWCGPQLWTRPWLQPFFPKVGSSLIGKGKEQHPVDPSRSSSVSVVSKCIWWYIPISENVWSMYPQCTQLTLEQIGLNCKGPLRCRIFSTNTYYLIYGGTPGSRTATVKLSRDFWLSRGWALLTLSCSRINCIYF